MTDDAVERLGRDWPLYTKRPVTIAAVKWDGEWKRMEAFVGASGHVIDGVLTIHTLEGDHHANVGDYIVRGVKDEFYPVKPDIFEMTYSAGMPSRDDAVSRGAVLAAFDCAWEDPHPVESMPCPCCDPMRDRINALPSRPLTAPVDRHAVARLIARIQELGGECERCGDHFHVKEECPL